VFYFNFGTSRGEKEERKGGAAVDLGCNLGGKSTAKPAAPQIRGKKGKRCRRPAITLGEKKEKGEKRSEFISY